MASGKLRGPTLRERWQRAACSRLKIELAGLAFARRRGCAPEEYARELWGRGAKGWMGKAHPTPLEYLRKEAEALAILYPWVEADPRQAAFGQAELLMTRGCLAGWEEERWTIAEGLGLSREEVCRYCQEAFQVWGQQLGLEVSATPQPAGGCLLRAQEIETGGA